jgi:tyrosine-specific transport protein
MNFGNLLKNAGLETAATLGAGIFVLPYVFYRAGWPTGIFYIFVLGFFIVTSHVLYFRVFRSVGKKESLFGFVRLRFGRAGFWIGLICVVGGLLLTLTAYLVLGGEFLSIIFPSIGREFSPFVFWGIAAFFLLAKRREFVKIELFGVAAIALIVGCIVFLSFTAEGAVKQVEGSADLFFPFGPIFFALAGWTAVEPIYESLKSKNFRVGEVPVFALGTALVVIIYLAFVAGATKITGSITPNIVLGLNRESVWPAVFSALGIISLLVSYEMISFEVSRALRYDLRAGKNIGTILAAILPPILVVSGLRNFLSILGFAGGVFLSLQYVFIILVSEKVLKLSGVKKFLLYLVSLVFVLAAVYEVYYFIIG